MLRSPRRIPRFHGSPVGGRRAEPKLRRVIVRYERETDDVCCLLLALFAFGPRLVLALEWIFGHRIQHAFAHWWWPLLGLIFLPWTTLMYTIVWSAGGVHGANWIAVALGAFLDLLSYSGRKAQKMYLQRSAAF